MRGYVGVTDGEWYRYLAARPELAEVNFWQPSGGRQFRALAPGEPFLFKTHYPHNRVVGGGFFSGSVPMKASEAWEYFGEANGTPNLERMLKATVELDLSQPWHRPGPVLGDPRLAPYRLGQDSFRAVVLDAYHRRCAVTGTHIPPVLQAAHIRPVEHGGEHRLDNGLLLRSDVHTLFDRGYLGVDARHRLLVSPRLRADFSNGDQFYAKAGQVIDLPAKRADRPGGEFVDWHLDIIFLTA